MRVGGGGDGDGGGGGGGGGGDTTKLQSDVALQTALKWREVCFLVRQNYVGKYSRSEANYFVLLKKEKFID